MDLGASRKWPAHAAREREKENHTLLEAKGKEYVKKTEELLLPVPLRGSKNRRTEREYF